MSVISFRDVIPPQRFDGIPWVAAEISEAATAAGPFTQIDSLPLIPLDTDPSEPQARDLTTSHATLTAGFYTIAFIDAHGAYSQPSDPIQNAATVLDHIRPTVEQLGQLMRARTVEQGTGGREVGTFNQNTRPTGEEVEELLDQAVETVVTAMGEDIPSRAYQQARFLVMLYAAQLVELTFYRNEVNRDQSAYQQYAQLYKDGEERLRKFIEDAVPAGPEAPFWSVPVLNQQQARFQAMVGAFDPVTKTFDLTKLPPDLWWPYGPGGIPSELFNVWPWLFDSPLGLSQGLGWLED